MKQDLVIGVTKNFKWAKLREYVISLDRTGFSGKRLMFISNIDAVTQRKLKQYGFDLIEFEPVEPKAVNRAPGWVFSAARWAPIVAYLKEHRKEFRYVVTTDVGDLAFQTDPAKWLEENLGAYELVGATECTVIKDDPRQDEWLKATVPDAYQTLREHITCCAGTLAGTAEAFYRVARTIQNTLDAAGPQGVDQSALIYAFACEPAGSVWMPGLEAGWTCTASWVIGLHERYPQFHPPEQALPVVEGTVFPIVDRVNGKIYTGDKNPRLFSIVHQHDRDPELLAAFLKRFSEPAPKILIQINSCVRDATSGVNQAARETFLKNITQHFPNADYKFFIGDGTPSNEDETKMWESLDDLAVCDPAYKAKVIKLASAYKPEPYVPKDDEVIVAAPDDYLHMPQKRKAALRWALEHGYQHIFLACTDTFIDIERLSKSGFEQTEYAGFPCRPAGTEYVFPCGGHGFWLSSYSARLLVDAPITKWSDDWWMGTVLKENNVVLQEDQRYCSKGLPRRTNDIISTHLLDTVWDANNAAKKVPLPELIRDAYQVSQTALKRLVLPASFRASRTSIIEKPKVLIAISSCQLFQNNGNNDAARDTWIKDVAKIEGLDYKFFTGGPAYCADEVHLDVPDDYQHVTYKTVENRRWAIARGYDFIFQTFPDVYIRPERLMAALDTTKDYIGYPLVDGHPYASGGAGYWNSKEASKYLLLEGEPWDWAEDRWVGEIMLKNGFVLYADKRYSSVAYPPLKRNEQITSHLSRGTGNYDKQWMYNTHKFWTLSQGV